jgi:hypothetical protein
LQAKAHPGDEAVLPDLASACHRAVTILLRRHDLLQYSAMVNDLGHGLRIGAEAGLRAEAPVLEESLERGDPGTNKSPY